MRTLVIQVDEQDYNAVKMVLGNLSLVKIVGEAKEGEMLSYTNPSTATTNPSSRTDDNASTKQPYLRLSTGTGLLTRTPNKPEIDEVTMASQASLAEDWDSEEDKAYDDLYNQFQSRPQTH